MFQKILINLVLGMRSEWETVKTRCQRKKSNGEGWESRPRPLGQWNRGKRNWLQLFRTACAV